MRLDLIFNGTILQEGLEDKMPSLVKEFPNLDQEQAEKLIRQIAESDPTNNKAYLPWLVRQVKKQFLRLPEDHERAMLALRAFDQGKRRATFTAQKDINSYKTFNDLEATIDKLQGVDLQSKRQQKRQAKEEGAEVVYEDSQYAIVEVHLAKAAVIYSKGTRWCTSNEGTAAHYLNQGPLHIIFKDGEKIAQMHIGSSQLKDVTDREFIPDEKLGKIIASNLNIKVTKPDEVFFIAKITRIRNKELEAKMLAAVHAATPTSQSGADVRLHRGSQQNLHGHQLYRYIKEVIGARWPEAEQYILQDPETAALYASDIIGSRWPEAEPQILKASPNTLTSYATKTIKGRWPEAESAILVEINSAIRYAKDVIKGRWPEVESRILENIGKGEFVTAISYADEVIGGRWPEVEQKLISSVSKNIYNAFYLLHYAVSVIKGRWPEAEGLILKSNTTTLFDYIRTVIKGRWARLEKAILNALQKIAVGDDWREIARLGFKYSRDVINDRWPELEVLLKSDPDYAELYERHIALRSGK
jgi:hypothetical protein